LAALLSIEADGNSWLNTRFQRVTPAAPTNTTSPGFTLNWSPSANADGDRASS
jgi:hypothetical protein